MNLYQEILIKMLAKEEIHIVFPNLQLNASEIVEHQCYQALNQIKAIIKDDSLSDFECIEEIVCILEQVGSSGGNRHDF